MAKKKEECPPVGAPAWMATYGDMVTLMLCFFVLLYAFSLVDEDKLLEFSSYFTGADPAIIDFEGSKGITGLLGNGIIEFPIPSEALDVVEEADSEKQEKIESYLDDVQRQLEEAYASSYEYTSSYETYTDYLTGSPNLSVNLANSMIEMELGSDFLFGSGSAELRRDFDFTVLADIILSLYEPGSIIVVEGHTDNVPMNSGSSRFKDNWVLSGARASAVINALIDATGLHPSCFESRGKAEFTPIAPNDTDEGRAANRRVVIYLKEPGFLSGG